AVGSALRAVIVPTQSVMPTRAALTAASGSRSNVRSATKRPSARVSGSDDSVLASKSPMAAPFSDDGHGVRDDRPVDPDTRARSVASQKRLIASTRGAERHRADY